MEPKTFEEAARQAAQGIEGCVGIDEGDPRDLIDIIDLYLDGDTTPDTEQDYTEMGCTALEGLGVLTRFSRPELLWWDVFPIVIAKQTDYGHDNINRFGLQGINVRMSDKVARIKNLTKVGPLAKNEPLKDSWLDLVGYSIVAIMVCRDTFKLPLAADLPKPYVWGGDTSAPFDCSDLVSQTFTVRPLPGGGIPATSLVRTAICENGDTYNWYSSSQSWVYAGKESK